MAEEHRAPMAGAPNGVKEADEVTQVRYRGHVIGVRFLCVICFMAAPVSESVVVPPVDQSYFSTVS